MSFVTAQQTKLDLELVPKEKRLEIRKCNGRLNPGKKQREPTFQVVLDALALTPCYSVFLTTADDPEVYIGHKKQDKMYYSRFTKVIVHHLLTKDKTISKRKKIGMHTFRDDYLINTLRFIYAKEESQVYGARLPKSMTSPEIQETKAYKTYLGYDTGVTPPKKARKFKKPASPKLSIVSVSPEEPTRKSKRVKRPAKKSSDAPTEDEFVKTPSNDTDDEDEIKIKDKTKGDEDKGMYYTTNQFDDDVNVRLNEPVTTDEGFIQKEGTDAEMTNVQQGNENLNIALNQVIDDAHVTVSIILQKTEVLVTSSSHSSDLAYKFLNFSDIPHTDIEIVSPMDFHVHHEEVSNFAPLVIKSNITESFEHAVLAKESLQPKSTYEAIATLTEFELKKILIDKIDKSQSYLTATEHRECYDGLIKSDDLNKSLFSTYDKVYSLKRSQKYKDKDEDPSAGSDQGLKKRKTSKDAELTKGPKTKESRSGLSKGTKSQSTSSGKSVQAEEPDFEVADSDMPQDQEENLGKDDEEPKGKVASKRDWFTKPKRPQEPTNYDWNEGKTPQQGPTQRPAFKHFKGTRSNYAELKYDFEECYRALSEKLDWDNPKDGDYPFDLTKPLPLVINRNRQMVPVDYCFDNDLKYLQGGISIMTYTTSITKTNSAQYDLPGIEDMVSNIWSPVKAAYDKHALWGRNRLMRLDELYKFNNCTLTRLQTSLDDITKNIQMEYLPQRIWSTLEKKRARIMIKAIDKGLKENRMMRSFEKVYLDWLIFPAYEAIFPAYQQESRKHVESLILKQAPKALYDELSTFLLQNGFSKGTIDSTLFTRRFDDDILVVNQSPSGIFIKQSKYVHEILKKYGLNTCDIIGTPMVIKDKLDLDHIGTLVDATEYRSMIGALMHLTSSRPDIVHATCVYARYQAQPIEKHLKEDTPIDRLEVLKYDIGKGSKVRTGIMPTETKLTLEQTQQVMMGILLEPTSNKLLVGDVGDSL
uniref:Reverse transcriptase Ty1/copia-type domain-containing protein n=1 Tax=Tanacetum cinerariifolium TaxID=118510 RepID=A0A6L2NX27_TANCI|nr:hypothetical protein [Tanacetum cinerariifolium]